MDMIQYSNTREYGQAPAHTLVEADKNTLFAAHKKASRPKGELSEVEQILLELELTDHLQKELDRCNLYFRNFNLTMEE
jgi:hypothetical protein